MKQIPKLSKDDIEFRKIYYSNPIIKERLLKSFQDREIIIMDKYDNQKCQRLHTIRKTEKTYLWNEELIDFYDLWINFINIDKINYNLYLSVAKYKYIPRFTLNPSFRSEESKRFWEVCHNYISSYDLFLDFDIEDKKDFEEMKREVLKCIDFIYKDKPLILASGNGIQLIYNSTTLDLTDFKKVTIFIEDLKNGRDLKFLCIYGYNLLTRFRKCEYSLNETMPVLILKPEEIQNFSYDKINKMSYKEKLELVIKRIQEEDKNV